MRKLLYFFLIAIFIPLLLNAAPQGGGGGGGGGGEDETGNNLSFPVIWAEDNPKTLRGTYGAPVFYQGDCSLPGAPCTIVDGVTYYHQQAEENEWQADSVMAITEAYGPVNVSWVDWGDNLEAKDWTLKSVVRVETVLYKDLAVPMPGFEMSYLFGEGPSEMWGTNTIVVDNPQATIFSRCARLSIQKLSIPRDDPNLNLTWNPLIGEWTGTVGETLYNGGVWEAEDGPGYYTGEVNVPGKVIYGYNWKLRQNNDGAGDYRLTFSLDPLYGTSEHCDAVLNTFIDANTQIVPPAEEEEGEVVDAEEPPSGGGVAKIDPVNGLTYIDVRITGRATGRLMEDDFEDGIVNWLVKKGEWNESGGVLKATGDPKALAVAPVPWTPSGMSRCKVCTIELDVRTTGGEFARVIIDGWYQDGGSKVELLIKEGSDKMILKQKAGGGVVAKAKGNIVIEPNVDYTIAMSFDGLQFHVLVDGTEIITMPSGAEPSGNVALKVTNTTASFSQISIF